MKKIKPLQDRILVKRLEEKETKKGGKKSRKELKQKLKDLDAPLVQESVNILVDMLGADARK